MVLQASKHARTHRTTWQLVQTELNFDFLFTRIPFLRMALSVSRMVPKGTFFKFDCSVGTVSYDTGIASVLVFL